MIVFIIVGLWLLASKCGAPSRLMQLYVYIPCYSSCHVVAMSFNDVFKTYGYACKLHSTKRTTLAPASG